MRFETVASPVKIWILFGAFCSAAGWVLSVCHAFHGIGYLGISLLTAAGLLVWNKYFRAAPTAVRQVNRGPCWPRLRRRFRRAGPMVYLALAVLTLAGGALHAPNNYDALAYRFPRVLHWLAESGWHWIHTPDARMNYSAPGFEWLLAPLLVFTRSDRGIFLINSASYLLLPGLLFSVFRQLGVRRLVAWHWMWLLPSGYGFVLQAGSVSNDNFASVYLLAALHFGLRARMTQRPADLGLAALAAGLLTGAKASNLPLLLPIVLAAWPAVRLLGRNLPATFAVAVLSALISFLPMAWLNYHQANDWTGDGGNLERLKVGRPLTGLLGNTLQLAGQNLAPPFFPGAKQWNERAFAGLPRSWQERLAQDFPRFTFNFGELQQEEVAGLGLGVMLLLVVSVGAALTRGWAGVATVHAAGPGRWICAAGGVALLVYCCRMGSESSARLVVAYYPLLLAGVLLLRGQELVVRQKWWRLTALAVGLSAIPVVVLTPSRPLWPAQTVLSRLGSAYPESQLVQRAQTVYSVYARRSDGLAALRKYLPANGVVGFISLPDRSELSLWRPFDGRRVEHLLRGDDLSALAGRRIEFLVVQASGLAQQFKKTLPELLAETKGKLVGHEELTVQVAVGTEDWYVVSLR